MNLRDLLKKSPIPLPEAEILLAHILKKDRSFLLAFPETQVTEPQAKEFNKLVNRRRNFEPVAYLLGYKDFFGLKFLVDSNVLIPRQDSEDLLEAVLKQARALSNPTIVDVGTGSGCIAISLATNLPRAKIIATDISSAALKVAKKNAKLHFVSERISFVETDLIETVNGSIDLIVANLPYIPLNKYTKLDQEIVAFEPRIALESGETEMSFYDKLFEQAKTRLKKTGKIFYEIDGLVYEKTL